MKKKTKSKKRSLRAIESLEAREMLTSVSVESSYRSEAFSLNYESAAGVDEYSYFEGVPRPGGGYFGYYQDDSGIDFSVAGTVEYTSPTSGTGTFAATGPNYVRATGLDQVLDPRISSQIFDCSSYVNEHRGTMFFEDNNGTIVGTSGSDASSSYLQYTDLSPGNVCGANNPIETSPFLNADLFSGDLDITSLPPQLNIDGSRDFSDGSTDLTVDLEFSTQVVFENTASADLQAEVSVAPDGTITAVASNIGGLAPAPADRATPVSQLRLFLTSDMTVTSKIGGEVVSPEPIYWNSDTVTQTITDLDTANASYLMVEIDSLTGENTSNNVAFFEIGDVVATEGIVGNEPFGFSQVSALNLGTGATYYGFSEANGDYQIDVPDGWYNVMAKSLFGETLVVGPVQPGATANFDQTATRLDDYYSDLVVTDNLGAYVAEFSESGNNTQRYSDWIPNVLDFGEGDLNGDGVGDIVGRDIRGNVYVGFGTGLSSFAVRQLGTLKDSSFQWTDFTVADFDADGKDDVLARASSDGSWWVLKSNGNEFTYQQVAKYDPIYDWTFVTGDFNGDGRVDIAGRAGSNGSWWVSVSNIDSTITSSWGEWTTNSAWNDFLVGDFNGDGFDDIAARANDQSWYVAESNGETFSTSYWAGWGGSDWEHFAVADLDGNGQEDLVGRSQNTGDWWGGLSSGNSFSQGRWGNWPTYTNWHDVQVGDFNADDLSDLIGRADNGEWWILESLGAGFSGRFGANFGSFVADSGVGTFGSPEPSSIGESDSSFIDLSAPIPSSTDSLFADFDSSGGIDFADFLILSTNFGQDGDLSQGDASGDGKIDFVDFLLLASNFGA